MNIALSIGHHPQAQGSLSADGQFTEYSFWKQHLPLLKHELEKLGHTAHIVNRANAGGKTPSYAAAACNEVNADLAIEFHFNSADSPVATGTETFYWATSTKGKIAAKLIQQAMVDVLGLPNRGIKPIYSPTQNAYEFFHRTRMPAILVEPSFAASNLIDCNQLNNSIQSISISLANVISNFEHSL